MREMVDYVYDTADIVRASAKRLAVFKIIQQDLNEDSVSFKPLCQTRWTVRGGAIAAVIANYSSLLIALDEISNECRFQEVGKKARGVHKIVDQFDYLFTLLLGDHLFGSVEILSRTLQSNSLSASGGRAAANV